MKNCNIFKAFADWLGESFRRIGKAFFYFFIVAFGFVSHPIRFIKQTKMTFNLALFLIYILLLVIIACLNPVILYPSYFINVMLRNMVELGLVALVMTMVIITGGIDLSVGSILVLSAIVGGKVALVGGGVVALLVTLAIGTLCGFINGFVIAKIKVAPMITTLATMYLYLGVARGISIGDSVYSFEIANFLGNFELFTVPIQIYIFVLIAAIMYYVLHKSAYGRSLYAIGLNENATKYSGINVDKVKIISYTLIGLMCAIASLMWLGRFTSIKYDAGTSLNLKIITIVVLGGCSITGGSGQIKSTIIATLLIGLLNSGLTVLNIPIDVQTVVNGAVLVVSLMSYSILNDKAKKSKIIKLDVAEKTTT